MIDDGEPDDQWVFGFDRCLMRGNQWKMLKMEDDHDLSNLKMTEDDEEFAREKSMEDGDDGCRLKEYDY